jgi:hypothetical protein
MKIRNVVRKLGGLLDDAEAFDEDVLEIAEYLIKTVREGKK